MYLLPVEQLPFQVVKWVKQKSAIIKETSHQPEGQAVELKHAYLKISGVDSKSDCENIDCYNSTLFYLHSI